MQIHRDRLRYLSYSLSAPVIATPVFVFLALLEAAGVLDVILSIVFVTIVPRIGIVRSARSSRLDYDIPERSARARPFMIAIASYLVGFLFLMIINAPVLLSGLMLAYSINTTVMFVITPSWKISVHAAGVTGPHHLPSVQARPRLEPSLPPSCTRGTRQNSAPTTHSVSNTRGRRSQRSPHVGRDILSSSLYPYVTVSRESTIK